MNAKTGSIKKKVLSWLLVLMMVITMIPATASVAGAEEGDTLFTVKYQDETKSVTEGMWNAWIADESYKIQESYSLMNNKGTITSQEYTGVSVSDIYTLLFDEFSYEGMSVNVGGTEISADELFATRYAYTVVDGSVSGDTEANVVEPIISSADNGTLVIGMKDQNTANQSLCRNGIFSNNPSIEIKTAAASGGESGGGESTEVTADKSWYNAEKSSFTLSDEADLIGFAELVNEGVTFKDKTVTLGKNISLSKEWIPIGNADKAFKGTFNGNNFTVSGLKITDAAGGYKGLFGKNDGIVKDFNIEGSIGSESSPIKSGADNIGGAVGYNDGTVKGVNAAVSVYVNTSIYAVGGVVGQNGDEGVIEQCVNTAYIEGKKATGGIAGRSYGIIRECVNTGEIKGTGGGKDGIGGICGLAGNKNDTCTNLEITDCYNIGKISNDNGRWHGGIAGFADDNICLQNCYDIGIIAPGYSWNWNPIVGHTDTADSGKGIINTICNNYSLEGLSYGDSNASSQPNTVGIIKTEDEFKTQDMVDLLGSNWAMDSYNKNNGYPVLKWQKSVFDKEAAAEVIAMLPSADDITGNADDIEAIKEAEAEYENLTEEAKALVIEAIEVAKKKVAAINHTSNGVTIEGLDWDKKVVVTPVDSGGEYDAMKAQVTAKTLLAMYDIEVKELIDGQWISYEIEKPVDVTIANDAFVGYINPDAIHQKEGADYATYETIKASFVENNKVKFTALSFSNYGIVAEKASVNNTTATDNEAKTGDAFNMIPVLVIMLLAAAGIAAVLYRRKYTD